MKPLLFYITIFISNCLFAQTDIDTLFSGVVGHPGKIIKKDSSGMYYVFDYDTTKIQFVADDGQFKMYNTKHNLLLEGEIGYRVCSQLVSKSGKWTSYYLNGKVKTEGYYERLNERIGLWKHFYPNGQLEKIYTLGHIDFDSAVGTCMIGTYEEYYENGQLKISGLYKAIYDTLSVATYDSLGNELSKKAIIKVPKSKAYGIWNYFQSSGQLLKKEYN